LRHFLAVGYIDYSNGHNFFPFSLFATYGALKRPHAFSQKHVNWFRRKICYDLTRDILVAAHIKEVKEEEAEEEPEYGAAMKTEENQSDESVLIL
jgi:hypothetical protein